MESRKTGVRGRIRRGGREKRGRERVKEGAMLNSASRVRNAMPKSKIFTVSENQYA